MFTDKQYYKGLKIVAFIANAFLTVSLIHRGVDDGRALFEYAVLWGMLTAGGTAFAMAFCEESEESKATSTPVVEAEKATGEVTKS